jgi:hypothetical protein
LRAVCDECGADLDEPDQQPDVSQVSVSRNAVQDWRGARTFAKACGGPAKALEVLHTLPDMPVTLLKEYLKVLGEE